MTDYRIPRSTIGGISSKQKPWKSVQNAYRAFCFCPPDQQAEFLGDLTPGQRVLTALTMLSGEIENGGHGQFFWNQSCRLTPEALRSLELIGAKSHRAILTEAIQAAKLSDNDFRDDKARRKKLKELGFQTFFSGFDQRFYELNEKPKESLEKFVLAYYKAHPTEFHISDKAYAEMLRQEAIARRTRNYRISKPRGKLGGEKLTWKLIEQIWDPYWEELKGEAEGFQEFLVNLAEGQRAVVAIDILNKTILNLNGVLGVVTENAGSQMLSDEITKGLALLRAKPYLALWSKWLVTIGDLGKQAAEAERLRKDFAHLRDTKGNEAASEAGKAFMAKSRSLRDRKEALESAGEKFDKKFKKLLADKKTAIENYIGDYVKGHPEQFFV